MWFPANLHSFNSATFNLCSKTDRGQERDFFPMAFFEDGCVYGFYKKNFSALEESLSRSP